MGSIIQSSLQFPMMDSDALLNIVLVTVAFCPRYAIFCTFWEVPSFFFSLCDLFCIYKSSTLPCKQINEHGFEAVHSVKSRALTDWINGINYSTYHLHWIISVVITDRNFEDFCSLPNLVHSHIIKWLAANNLALNFNTMNMICYDIFVNCNWVVTLWQQYSTHLHTNNT